MGSDLPLTPAVFAILLALVDGDKHGYAVMKEASVISPGIKLGPGTLYGALDRLSAAGLVIELDTMDDARRRHYRLTPQGISILAAETQRMQAAVTIATRRLAVREARP